jgi:ferritin-like protein
MNNYHEPPQSLSNTTMDRMRALHSLKEEVEAIDWYQQRFENTASAELKRILKHNMDEEIEHACMMLEWLRRNMDGWDEHLKNFLFTNEK